MNHRDTVTLQQKNSAGSGACPWASLVHRLSIGFSEKSTDFSGSDCNLLFQSETGSFEVSKSWDSWATFFRNVLGRDMGCPILWGSTFKCRRLKRHRFDSWVRKTLCRRKQQPTPVLLPGKFHGQRSLVGYSPWGRKELDTSKIEGAHVLPQGS